MSLAAILAELHAVAELPVEERVSLAQYTSSRIGGPADILVIARTSEQMVHAAQVCWQHGVDFYLLGAGSNVLVSDQGVRGVVILNKTRNSEFFTGPGMHVWAESGANLSNLARRAAAQGFTGLEWASTIPGSVGGAVYGNAGAFGGDIASDLLRAEILTERGREWWPSTRMEYGYRTSTFKRSHIRAVILSARFKLKNGHPEEIQATMERLNARRKATQPPGASMGSMFKNPLGDYAGRLIEAAGLKGMDHGNAQISPVHGNFFINKGEASASDMKALIDLTQQTVKEKFSVQLELEVELVGEW